MKQDPFGVGDPGAHLMSPSSGANNHGREPAGMGAQGDLAPGGSISRHRERLARAWPQRPYAPTQHRQHAGTLMPSARPRGKLRIPALHPLLLVLPLLASGLAGCERSQPQAQGAPPPPQVTVAKPSRQLVTEWDEYVGRFVAVDSIEVRARVSGYLNAIHFQDGQLINKGDLLFTIDRRPFEATLAQAQATLAQARANLAFAEADLERGANLVRGNTITQQTFDQRMQAKRVADANVAAQEAALRQALLDLEFTELRAPVSGRIGDRRVSPGNLVTGGTTGTT